MAKYERTLTGDFQEVLSFLERTIQASGGFLHFVDGTDCDLGNTRIAVRVYDRYYMRNNSRASLTLTVIGCGNTVTVSAISSVFNAKFALIVGLSRCLDSIDGIININIYCL